VHAGLTRVVWELNEVGPGDGGTLLLSGSHKAAFPLPDALSDRDSPLWETYSCPAGSVLIFTEALCHSGARWNNEQRDRLSVFTCYNTVNAKWGKGRPTSEVIESMPPKRRTLFRGVWHGMGDVPGVNRYEDESNRSV
jgi:ectoine hydroxylase-related dioxygenase (phytanoyl-CoA dioxygenase family)